MDTLQQELQEQIQQLTHQVEEKQHTMQVTAELQQNLLQHEQTNSQLRRDLQLAVEEKQSGDRQLQELTERLQVHEQLTVEFQRNLLQHKQTNRQLQETVGQLRRDLQQAVEEKQAGERQLQELTQQLQTTKLAGAQTITPQLATQPQDTITRHRQELQQAQPVEHAAVGQQKQLQKPKTQLMKWTVTPPPKALVQQKTIRDIKWQKESKALERMRRGSAASDSNMAYFNGWDSTKVYGYDSDTQKWYHLPDNRHTWSTLVVVQHILTMVGGYLSGKVTNSLLSLMGEGRAMKWLPHFPGMPTARSYTAAVCSGHSLIVAGGESEGRISLATVEVLDIDTQQWLIACSLPNPCSEAAISICRERLYLMGGFNKTGNATRSVLTCSVPELLQSRSEKLRMEPAKPTTIWRHIADVPYDRSSCAPSVGSWLPWEGGKMGRTLQPFLSIKKQQTCGKQWETCQPLDAWL